MCLNWNQNKHLNKEMTRDLAPNSNFGKINLRISILSGNNYNPLKSKTFLNFWKETNLLILTLSPSFREMYNKQELKLMITLDF